MPRADRYPVPPVRPRSRRSATDRLIVRAPRFARLLRLGYFRLPRGSRLRREVLVAGARGGLEAFNRRDWAVFVDQYAEDAEYVLMPGQGGLLAPDLANRYVGPSGVREFFRAWDEAWS